MKAAKPWVAWKALEVFESRLGCWPAARALGLETNLSPCAVLSMAGARRQASSSHS